MTVFLVEPCNWNFSSVKLWNNSVFDNWDWVDIILFVLYFKTKNQSPKKLSGEEAFVAEVRSEDYAAGVCLTYMKIAGIRLDIHPDKLPELEEDPKITMKTLGLFKSEYNLNID